MAALFEELLIKYASKGLLIDTNLLLIYLAGLPRADFVERLSRNTKGYTAEDHARLTRAVGLFHELVTTPHVLAEVSNLSNHFTFKRKEPDLSAYLDRALLVLRSAHEESVSKDVILSDPWLWVLPKIGITDISIMAVARERRYLVLTDDAALFGRLTHSGLDALNFTHLRFLR